MDQNYEDPNFLIDDEQILNENFEPENDYSFFYIPESKNLSS